MSGPVGKILVIRGGAIGDFILTLPVLRALRETFPRAGIEVLGYPHIVELAVVGGLVDQAQSIEARALAFFFARGGDLDPSLSRYFAGFDLILSYLYDPDSIFRSNVARCSRAQFVQGPHRPDETQCTPASRVYLKPLERLAIFESDDVPCLNLKGVQREGGQAPSEGGCFSRNGVLVMHPGSGSERKNWDGHRWEGLLRLLLARTGCHFLLVGGEAEVPRLRVLGKLLPPDRGGVAIGLPLPELARQMCGCGGFLGHDSGIAHLASALGLSGVVLWGPSRAEIWRPPSSKFRVLQHPCGLGALEVGEVFAALCEHLQMGSTLD